MKPDISFAPDNHYYRADKKATRATLDSIQNHPFFKACFVMDAAKVRLVQGVALEKAGNWTAALAHWQGAAKELPQNAHILLRAAGSALRIPDLDAAQQHLDALRKHDGAAEHVQQADHLATRLAQMQASRDAAQHRAVLAQIFEDGVALEKAGNWTAALAHWQGAAKELPQNAHILLRAAGSALRIPDLDAAQQHLDALRKHDGAAEHVQQADHLAGLTAFEAGDFLAARKYFLRFYKSCPDHPKAAMLLRIANGLAPDFGDILQRERPQVLQRVYLTGCGRSGTWMLAAMLTGIENLKSAEGECPIGAFLDMPDLPEIHMIKRQHNACRFFDRIPADIKIVHIVRHPWDVLVSQHRQTARHVSLERIQSEHRAFFNHLLGRPNTLVLKYESVVTEPKNVQIAVEDFLCAKARTDFSDFWHNQSLPKDIVEAMHGLRPLDPSGINSWRKKPEEKEYLKALHRQSDGILERMAKHFSYDLTL